METNKKSHKIKLGFIGWILTGTMALRMPVANLVSLTVCKAALFLKWVTHLVSYTII